MSLPAEPIIDVWVQHPTSDFLRDPLFDTLRRWMHLTEVPPTISPQLTLGALEAAHVQTAIVTASWGPRGPLLSNEAFYLSVCDTVLLCTSYWQCFRVPLVIWNPGRLANCSWTCFALAGS